MTARDNSTLSSDDCHRLRLLSAELELRLPRDPHEAAFVWAVVRELWIGKTCPKLRSRPRLRVVK